MSPAWSHLSRRIALGLAFALLLAALAPAVSRTLASLRAPGQGGWVEVCSAGGVQRLTGDQGTETPPQPGHLALDACALCVLAAERFAPLMPAAWVVPILLGGTPPPQALSWRFAAWSSLLPSARDPPTVS